MPLKQFNLSINSMKESSDNPIFINDFKKIKKHSFNNVDPNKTFDDIL